MNRKSIINLPNAHLRQKSLKVTKFDADLANLVDEMKKASIDWEKHREHEFCVGLAAVQVDRLHKVVILRDNLEDKSDQSFTAIINPKLIKTYGELEVDFEGCLSVRDIYVKVPRYPKVKIKAQDLDGEEFRMTVDGFQSRLLQHEIDHTNGIVMIDHVKNSPESFFRIAEDGKIEKLDYDERIEGNNELWN